MTTTHTTNTTADSTILNQNLTSKQLKAMITPDAFTVDKALYGIRLARPWRRGGAMLIDLLLVAILAKQNVAFLAIIAAATFIKVGRDYKQVKRWRRTRKVLRFVSFVILLIVIFRVVGPAYDDIVHPQKSQQQLSVDDSVQKGQSTSESENEKGQSTSESKNEKGQSDSQGEEQSTSLTSWVKGFIVDDLGFGFGWAAFYFTLFTAWWQGQTPGKRLFSIKVLQLDGTPLSLWASFGRYGGYGAGFATGLLGFAQILWDGNRQAIQDKISATVVVNADMAKVSLYAAISSDETKTEQAKLDSQVLDKTN